MAATDDYQPTERRPIASRESTPSRHVATWLARRGASANAISLGGMLAAILAGGVFGSTSLAELPNWTIRLLWLIGAVLVQVRLLANMFDGMVAIQRGIASPLGELYNEVPDRISDAAIFIGLGYSLGGVPALGYLAALGAVLTA